MIRPFRRPGRVLNPGGGPAQVDDTDTLDGDELIDVGGGRTMRVADLLADPTLIPFRDPEEPR